ncbi:MAG: hypothetical protein U1F46_05570 [Marinagarivorans sp.]
MNQLLILLVLITTTSCTFNKFRAEQHFEEKNPSFYMSVAPSFSQPFEYEINSDELVLRKYYGLGGYNWGRKKEVCRVKVTLEQKNNIRQLSIATIRESITEEKEDEEIVVMDGTSWYILTDFGFGPFLSYSTNNPGDTMYRLREYLDTLASNK